MEKGECKYGVRCLFAHGEHEMYRRKPKPEVSESEKKPEELNETTQESTKQEVTLDSNNQEPEKVSSSKDDSNFALELSNDEATLD